EVAHQPGPERFRLADVDELPVAAEHAVHAGELGGRLPDPGPELRSLSRPDTTEIRGEFGRPREGRAEPAESVYGEQRRHSAESFRVDARAAGEWARGGIVVLPPSERQSHLFSDDPRVYTPGLIPTIARKPPCRTPRVAPCSPFSSPSRRPRPTGSRPR